MIVWVIGRNYPLPENGMSGSFELEQAKMLSRFGNDVRYLACTLHPVKRTGGRTGIWSRTDEGVKVSVLSAFFAPRVYPVCFVGARNRLWKKLLDEVEKNGGLPDVIHVHYPAMLMLADALAPYREKGVRIVSTEHWSKVLARRLDRIERREYRKFAGVADHMLCVGRPLSEAVRDYTGKDAAVVPNIVSERFRPAAEGHEGFRFVAVGRLIKLRQFDRIIEAFCDCFLGRKDVTLTIVGGGEEGKRLRRLIAKRGAAEQVFLTGSQTREKTAELVAGCDALVCYSALETFGVPIIEAWACGLPVVATTAAAVLDRFDERLGVEVSFDDDDGLKNALRSVYAHRDGYDGAFIREFALARFSEAAVYERLLQIYRGEKSTKRSEW